MQNRRTQRNGCIRIIANIDGQFMSRIVGDEAKRKDGLVGTDETTKTKLMNYFKL
jgi:hypothetical protein